MNANIIAKNKTNLILAGSSRVPNTSASEAPKPEDDFEGRVKTRLLSMWNNMKYGWTIKTKTNFSKESPVWLLGRCYHKKCESENRGLSEEEQPELGRDIASETDGEVAGAEDDDDDEGIEAFKVDFQSRLWLTYRREFPVLDGSSLSSDCGWGCMLRSGQMLLGQALLVHLLGRDWRWRDEPDTPDEYTHRAIVRLFGDRPVRNSPLSIHRLVQLGATLGKQPGDWYGPAFVAHLLRRAVREAAKEDARLARLTVYVAQDCCVYVRDVLDECESDGEWRSPVLLVPLRLGADKLNHVYAPCLTTLLSHEMCIGIIGGRPKHSLYFVGYQEDKLIHLDPHYCQEVVDVWSDRFPLQSFHCRSPRKLHLSKMDPSCCVGFYCATRDDLLALVASVRPFLVPPSSRYPMFVFSEGRRADVPHAPLTHLKHDDCDEFEIL